MHCRCCDAQLTDYESTRKHIDTGEYLDVCNQCFAYVRDSIQSIGRIDQETLLDEIALDIYPERDSDYLDGDIVNNPEQD
jgi:hypothetical protein